MCIAACVLQCSNWTCRHRWLCIVRQVVCHIWCGDTGLRRLFCKAASSAVVDQRHLFFSHTTTVCAASVANVARLYVVVRKPPRMEVLQRIQGVHPCIQDCNLAKPCLHLSLQRRSQPWQEYGLQQLPVHRHGSALPHQRHAKVRQLLLLLPITNIVAGFSQEQCVHPLALLKQFAPKPLQWQCEERDKGGTRREAGGGGQDATLY